VRPASPDRRLLTLVGIAGVLVVGGCSAPDGVTTTSGAPSASMSSTDAPHVPGDPTVRDEVRDAAAAGTTTLVRLWPDAAGAHWSVEVPSDLGAFAAGLGRPAADVASLAAATTYPGNGAAAVVHVNPVVWPSLTAFGKRAVVTHELVHAWMGPLPGVPHWLLEGLADTVAFTDASQARRSALLGSLGADARPVLPPSDVALDSASGEAAQGYALAWFLVDRLVAASSVQQVAALAARLDRESAADQDATLREGVRRLTGTTYAAWLSQARQALAARR